MSDEIKTENEHKCICQNESFRKFLVIALGSFVGVFCALSLFAALHKPPMMPCPCGHQFARPFPCHMKHFDKLKMKDFEVEKKVPIEVQKVNIDD